MPILSNCVTYLSALTTFRAPAAAPPPPRIASPNILWAPTLQPYGRCRAILSTDRESVRHPETATGRFPSCTSTRLTLQPPRWRRWPWQPAQPWNADDEDEAYDDEGDDGWLMEWTEVETGDMWVGAVPKGRGVWMAGELAVQGIEGEEAVVLFDAETEWADGWEGCGDGEDSGWEADDEAEDEEKNDTTDNGDSSVEENNEGADE